MIGTSVHGDRVEGACGLIWRFCAVVLSVLLQSGCQEPVSTESSSGEAEEYLLGKLNRFNDVVRSRWPVETHTILASDYRSGFAHNYDVVVVVNEIADSIPEPLLTDIRTVGEHEVVWIGWNSSTILNSLGIAGTAYEASADSQMHYASLDLDGTGMVVTDPIELPSHSGLEVLAYLNKDDTERSLIVEFEERLLVVPFELPNFYYHVDSYVSGFLDILDRSMGPPRSVEKLALMRLEDVNPYTYSDEGESIQPLRDVWDYLREEQIPFSIALISRYINPAEGIDMSVADNDDFAALLRQMVHTGQASLIQHGYTHQFDGVSGDDSEFWDENKDAPVQGDSSAWVVSRIMGAQKAMMDADLALPRIWESPHYMESKLDDEVINAFFKYRNDPSPVGNVAFPIKMDGVTYIPENLDYIENLEADLKTMEVKLDVLSHLDGAVASVFWHPYRDIKELHAVISLVRSKGFRFASVAEVLSPLEHAPYTFASSGRKRVLFVAL